MTTLNMNNVVTAADLQRIASMVSKIDDQRRELEAVYTSDDLTDVQQGQLADAFRQLGEAKSSIEAAWSNLRIVRESIEQGIRREVVINRDHAQFIAAMERRGYELRHYNGRNFWSGPAAETSDAVSSQEIMSATKVRLQSDNMGRDFVYYPVSSDSRDNPCRACKKLLSEVA